MAKKFLYYGLQKKDLRILTKAAKKHQKEIRVREAEEAAVLDLKLRVKALNKG